MHEKRYLGRHLGARLREDLQQFPIIWLQGARQVGKTTFLEHELPGWPRYDLEDAGTAGLVAADPALFLRDHPGPVWFDEAHRVPGIFPALRVAVDRDRRPGRYVLSGSAAGPMATRVSESLAGRAGVLTLPPLSLVERLERAPSPFLELAGQCGDAGELLRLLASRSSVPDAELRAAWFSGGFPEPALLGDPARARWFSSYIRLVSERDLGELHQDLRPPAVLRLLRMLAARHAQPVNVSALATDFGASRARLAGFLDLLEGTCLWCRVEAFSDNLGKRLVRTPRGYLADSGLLHALLELRRPADLEVHPIVGPSWEGFVREQLAAQAALLDLPHRFHCWRTQAGAEVDLVLEQGERLLPVEIKRATSVGPYDLRGMRSFIEGYGPRAPFGVVLYRGDNCVRATERIVLVPVGLAVG